MITSFILIVSLAFPSPIVYALSPQQMKRVGQVRGTVKTVGGKQGIPLAEVTLEGEPGTFTVTTDSMGVYKIEAPPGIYRLKFQTRECSRIHLAAFRLPPAEMLMPDVAFEPCGIKVILGPNYKEREEILYDFKEECFSTSSKADEPSELFIRYGQRRHSMGGVESYRGMWVSYGEFDENARHWNERDEYVRAMVSYHGLLIYADTVNFDKNTLRLEAERNVTIYKGSESRKAKRVKVDFSARNPIETIQIEQ